MHQQFVIINSSGVLRESSGVFSSRGAANERADALNRQLGVRNEYAAIPLRNVSPVSQPAGKLYFNALHHVYFTKLHGKAWGIEVLCACHIREL